jgi:HK97 family phage prohead protease
MSKTQQPSEYKTFPYIELKREDDQGIVEHLITVFGIIDHGKDMSHPGAFAKTIAERGNKIRVLDAHNTDSVLRIVGKPLALKEIGRDELPATVLEEYPEATGGLWARTQFLMDTPEGKGVFTRIKEGSLGEFSYGYDALDYDYDTVKADGEDIEVRNLRTVRLWEYSPVLWGMNPATATMSAKEDVVEPEPEPEAEKITPEPEEMKPEVTENYVRIPVDSGDHEGHRIRTIEITEGIKALYCGECKKVITYLFDKDKYSVAEARAWIAAHKKSVDDAIAHKWLTIPEDELEVDEAALLADIQKSLIEIGLFEIA